MGAAMRRIQAGNALTAFGIGFTVPFLYIYVAQVRGLGSMAATSAFVAFALGALVALPFTGRVIDRRGPVPVVLGAAVAASAGALALGLSTGIAAILLSALALGAGQAVMQPALATMIVWCSTPATRTRSFALQFFMQNLGLGIGGLIGGQIVDENRPGSFTLLFGIEAVMFLVLAAVILTVRMPHAPVIKDAVPRDPAQAGGSGWQRLLRHKAMVKLLVLGFVIFFACYGQFESGLAAFGTEAAGISPSTLGFALAANTGAIVVAQFVVLKLVEKRRRSRVIALVGLIWTVAWVIAGFSGLGHGSAMMAAAAFISTYALFGIGEAMLSPTLAPLVADLAPEGSVGQYNSAFALVKQMALALGPLGVPLGAGVPMLYIGTFIVVSLGIAALALRLGKQLSPAQDNPSLVGSRIVAQGPAAGSKVGEPVAA
ncbi:MULTISPECIES: MFS transporter [Streptomyces]|uniref:MFS transporter n=1 Tax=Streptomyces TaxID=1883 RepID=UPI00017E9D93|nr:MULTISPECIES: MFS transporter [Streptomyces]EDX22405.1 integral membrane protein [Streptomyces sp. Mg1]RPK49548.1 putative transporter [Streptomyces sp. ADI91-18]WSS03213.1 MFS transporter [Streptomyces goshikiensis]WSY02353.1 MFS transporter [Streptomyces goshikiensis]